MSNIARPQEAITDIFGEWGSEELQIIRDSVAKGASDAQLRVYLWTAKKLDLDPMRRQIYSIPYGGLRQVVVGIDGLRLIASRSGVYAGSDDAVFEYADGYTKYPYKASVTVYKLVGGILGKFTGSARWDEFAPLNHNGEPTGQWAKMPHVMLGKVAEAAAIRKAFPQEAGGVYTTDEMEQAGAGMVIEESQEASTPAIPQRAQTPPPQTKQQALPPKPAAKPQSPAGNTAQAPAVSHGEAISQFNAIAKNLYPGKSNPDIVAILTGKQIAALAWNTEDWRHYLSLLTAKLDENGAEKPVPQAPVTVDVPAQSAAEVDEGPIEPDPFADDAEESTAPPLTKKEAQEQFLTLAAAVGITEKKEVGELVSKILRERPRESTLEVWLKASGIVHNDPQNWNEAVEQIISARPAAEAAPADPA